MRSRWMVALGMCFLAGTATAAGPAIGTGNFRRAEVLKAAGANKQTTRVAGLAVVLRHRSPRLSNPAATTRMMLVEDWSAKKVRVVRAPLDKTKKVEQIGAAELRKFGLISQWQGGKLVEKQGGRYQKLGGTAENVGLSNKGMSYRFRQKVEPPATIKQGTSQGTMRRIYRSVPVDGLLSGSSAEPLILWKRP